jgi:hypothetical protein
MSPTSHPRLNGRGGNGDYLAVVPMDSMEPVATKHRPAQRYLTRKEWWIPGLYVDEDDYYRFTGGEMDTETFDEAALDLGRNEGPALLFDLHCQRIIDVGEHPAVVASVWTTAEFPGPRCAITVATITTTATATATTNAAGITTFLRRHHRRGRGGWAGGRPTAGCMPGVGGAGIGGPGGEPCMVAACGHTPPGGATSPVSAGRVG